MPVEIEQETDRRQAQGEDTERQNETERRDEMDTNAAPKETAQEAPCEDGVSSDNGMPT